MNRLHPWQSWKNSRSSAAANYSCAVAKPMSRTLKPPISPMINVARMIRIEGTRSGATTERQRTAEQPPRHGVAQDSDAESNTARVEDHGMRGGWFGTTRVPIAVPMGIALSTLASAVGPRVA